MGREINNFICIDPSIRRLGASIYRGGKLTDAFLVSQDGKGDWRKRAMAMSYAICTNVQYWIHSYPFNVLTEIPENWQGERGVTSRDSEAVQKLYYFVGLMVGMLASTGITYVFGVTPTKWKGQTPKKIMIKRGWTWCEEQGYNPSFEDDNVMEAILLGKYFIRHEKDIVLPYITLVTSSRTNPSPPPPIDRIYQGPKELEHVTIDRC